MVRPWSPGAPSSRKVVTADRLVGVFYHPRRQIRAAISRTRSPHSGSDDKYPLRVAPILAIKSIRFSPSAGRGASSRFSSGRSNTADKLRSGARVRPGRRGHEPAPPSAERCRRKLRQLHPLVRRRVPYHVHRLRHRDDRRPSATGGDSSSRCARSTTAATAMSQPRTSCDAAGCHACLPTAAVRVRLAPAPPSRSTAGDGRLLAAYDGHTSRPVRSARSATARS